MARTSKSRGATPFTMKSGNSTSFKAMGSSPMRDEKKEKEKASDRDELVRYTDPNYQPDWGSATVTPYETMISKGTKRLIEAGAPKELIEKEETESRKRREKAEAAQTAANTQ